MSFVHLIFSVHNITVNNSELFILDSEMHDYERENEGTDIHGQQQQQQHYSDEETTNGRADHGGNRFLQETDSREGENYSTAEDRRNRPNQIRSSHGSTTYGSKERYDHDEDHFITKDSHHSVTTHSKANACLDTVARDNEVTQGTVAKDTNVTQGTLQVLLLTLIQ